MKIVVLEGSPHRHGASNALADCFIKGAEEAGHSVTVLDVARMNIHPCLGCPLEKCTGQNLPCVQKDDGQQLREHIPGCDMLVFVTPIYFYGSSAQLKVALDRFHCFYQHLKTRHIKSALLATACRTDEEVFSYVDNIYHGLVRYLNFEDCGSILAGGCGYSSLAGDSVYRQQAHALGRSLK